MKVQILLVPQREEPEGVPLFCPWGSLWGLQAGLCPGCGCVAGILTPGAIQPLLTPTMPSSRPREREEGGWWLGHLLGAGQWKQGDPLAIKKLFWECA